MLQLLTPFPRVYAVVNRIGQGTCSASTLKSKIYTMYAINRKCWIQSFCPLDPNDMHSILSIWVQNLVKCLISCQLICPRKSKFAREKKINGKCWVNPQLENYTILISATFMKTTKRGRNKRDKKREMDGEYLMKDSPLRGLSSELG